MLITNEDIVGMYFFSGYYIVNSIITLYYMAMHVQHSLIDQSSEGFIRHGQKAL